MGHQVDHLGSFTVSPRMDDDLRTWLDDEFIFEPWEVAAERGLPVPDHISSNCTWWSGDGDGSTLSWTGAEKSYEGTAWLQWLSEHVLGPAGHEVRGTVHRFAEPESTFVEASRIVADEDGIREEPFDVRELPWRDEGPWLSDAFFHLLEGTPEEAQTTLLTWLESTPLADNPRLAAFLDEVATYWPDPAAVRAALADARTRGAQAPTAPPPPASPLRGTPTKRGAAKRSLWDRLRGR